MSEAVETRKENERQEADAKAQVDAENQKIRAANCELALDRQRKYDQAIRLYRPTEDGGRDYLTDQELDNGAGRGQPSR